MTDADQVPSSEISRTLVSDDAVARLFERFLGQIPEAAIALNDDGVVTWLNPQASQTFAMRPGEFIDSLIDSGSKTKLARSLEKVRNDEDVITEIVLVVDNRPVLHSIHLFRYESHLILMARRSSEDADRFLEMSAMLSEFATLYRESNQQRIELEEQGTQLASISRELDGERRRLLSLIDQLPEGIVLVNDQSGDIVLTNLRIQELWGRLSAPAQVDEIPLHTTEGDPVDVHDLPIFRSFRTKRDEGPFEYLIYPAGDGDDAVNVQVLASPVLDEDNNVIGSAMSIVDVTEQKRMRDELAIQAVQDPLTGLGNRRVLFQRIEQALADVSDIGAMIAVLYVDLDGFKAINDNLGHEAGDEALMEVAARLNKAVRDGDTVARLGGDEFAILLTSIVDRNDVEVVVRRVLEVLSDMMEIHGHRVRLPGSIGISMASKDSGITASEIIRQSDLAMYQAKARGSSRWAYYHEFGEHAERAPLSLTEEIHHALDTEQFELLYRPVVDLQTGRIREVEIALFWRHSTEGLLDDNEIKVRAWRAGLIHSIAERAADLAEADRPLMLEAIGHRPQVIMSRHYWIDYLREKRIVDQIAQIGLDIKDTPIRVRLELSGRLLRGDDAMIEQLLRLQDASIEFSMSHAGDYDGDLALLQHLPVEAIVASSELVSAAMHDDRARRLLRTVVATARVFDVPTKAPAVDTPETLELVRTLGFDLGSGEYFSRPLTVLELLELGIDRSFQVDNS